MKKRLLNLTFFLSFSCFVVAQSSSLDAIYQKYHDHTLSINVSIPGWVAGKVIGSEHQAVKTAIRKAKNFRLILSEDLDPLEWRNDLRSLKKDLKKDHFEPMVYFRDGSDEIEVFFYEKENLEEYSELVFLIHDDGEGVLLSFQGTFNQDDIEKIMKEVQEGEL